MAENKIKIQNVLSEQLDKHCYIVWYDTDGRMEERVTGMDIVQCRHSLALCYGG